MEQLVSEKYTNFKFRQDIAISSRDNLSFYTKRKNSQLFNQIERYCVSKVNLMDKINNLTKILLNDEIKLENDKRKEKIEKVMVRGRFIVARENAIAFKGKKTEKKDRIERVPLLDESGRIMGLAAIKDMDKSIRYPSRSPYSKNRFLLGVSVEIEEDILSKVDILVKAKVDALIIDEEPKYCKRVLDAVKKIKAKYPELQIWCLRI